jgi:2-polyprenyl-6-methoxyphenol hydroxylase-like FAD-dependent oxidoreductase
MTASLEPSLHEAPVLVVGAGPVGLTLALDLARRGVPCLLVDQSETARFLPKMERCNARSMEIFRRLGLAEKIKSAGYPGTATMDIKVVTRLSDPPLLHLRYPTADEQRRQIAFSRDGSQPLEAFQVISQYTLEPLLRAEVAATAPITARYGWQLVSFTQDDHGVSAVLQDRQGERHEVRARYLVGCDGGRSTVRKALGIPLEGKGNLAEATQLFFRSENLLERVPAGPARHYYFADEHSSGIVGQDDLKHFFFSTRLPPDADLKAALLAAVGVDIDVQVIAVSTWRQHLLLAQRYQDRRVFLAGDACHLVIPLGGLGMNTGVGDATDLAWKLAATLQGWGGPTLLDSYEADRRPVGARNVEASGYATAGLREWRSLVKPGIRNDDEEGRRLRDTVAAKARRLQRRTHEMAAAELGYRYTSPVIVEEPGPVAGAANKLVYVPSAAPGFRLPHVWLDDGQALHDLLGLGYALLRLGDDAPSSEPVAAAFRAAGVPLQVLDISSERAREVYGRALLLVRPDLHVAWRGDAPPADAAALVRQVTGGAG